MKTPYTHKIEHPYIHNGKIVPLDLQKGIKALRIDIDDAEGKTVGYAIGMSGNQGYGPIEDVEANARLFAAAPDLLIALEKAETLLNSLRQYLPKSIQNSDRFNFENTLANVIKPAIQKAK